MINVRPTPSSLARITVHCCLNLLLFLSFSTAFGQGPYCVDKNCRAGDIATANYFLGDASMSPISGTCTPGSDVTGVFLYVTFDVSSNERYDVNLVGDIHIDGVYTSMFSVCMGDFLSGIHTVQIQPIVWSCGSELEIRNTLFAWENNQNDDRDNPDICDQCPAVTSKCKRIDNPITVRTPLIADFTSSNSCVVGNQFETVTFVSDVTGGKPSYSHMWDFGDMNTSTDVNPTHTYLSAGNYTVKLTVSDSDNPQNINIIEKQITVASCCTPSATCKVLTPYTGPACTIPANRSIQDVFDYEACDAAVTMTVVDDGDLNCEGGFDFTRTYTLNLDGTPFEVCTEDIALTLPAILCPTSSEDITISACMTEDEFNTTFANWMNTLGRSATGGCGTLEISIAPFPTPDACGGETIVTYTLTDECGQSVDCQAKFSVEENSIPIIDDINDYELVGCNTEWPVLTTTWTDDCDDTSEPIVGQATDIINMDECTEGRDYIFNKTDACGNQAAQVVVRVTRRHDETPPTIMGPSGDITLDCNTPPTTPAYTAMDNCGVDAQVIVTPGEIMPGAGCSMSQSFTANVMDNCGIPAVPVTVTYTWIEDDEGPTFDDCPTDPIDLGCSAAPTSDMAIAEAGTPSDNCGIAETTAVGGPITGSSCGKSQTWTVTAKDGCGEAGTCEVTFTWTESGSNPMINCPANVTLACNEMGVCLSFDALSTGAKISSINTDLGAVGISTQGGSGNTAMVFNTASPSGGDPDLGTPNIAFGGPGIGAGGGPGLYQNDRSLGKVLIVSADGNSSDPDDASSTGTSLTFDFSAIGLVTVEHLTMIDVDDNNQASGGHIKMYDASNNLLHTANFAQAGDNSVQLVNLGPTSGVEKMVVKLNGSGAIDNICFTTGTPTGFPTGTASCGALNFSFVDAISNNGCTKVITRTWTGRDLCGKSASCVQTITAPTDEVAPVITDMADYTLDGCNTEWPDISFDWTDNCGVDGNTSGSKPATAGAVTTQGCSEMRTYSVTVTDDCGNPTTESVTVSRKVDNTPPTFSNCPDPIDLGCSEAPTEEMALAAAGTPSDACGLGENSVEATPGTIFIDGCDRTQTWTISIEDACGNPGSCDVTYTWIEQVELGISCPDPVEFGADEQQPVTDTFEIWKNSFTFSGGCNAAPTYEVRINGGIAFAQDPATLTAPDFCSGDEITVLMTVNSDCQEVQCSSSFVVVVDAQGFNIALPGQATACFPGPVPPAMADVPVYESLQLLSFAVLDPCIEEDQVQVSAATTGPEIDGDEYTFMTVYTVSAPNAVTDMIMSPYTFKWDPNPPTLSGLPEDITIQCGEELPEWPEVSAFDVEFGPADVSTSSTKRPTFCGEIVQRFWTAKDDCGNTMTGVQNIHIVDEEAPKLVVPSDTTLECGDEVPAPTYDASDNCSDYRVTFTESRVDHNDCEYTITRTWIARDECYNSTTATQVITVLDTKAPEITIINPMIAGMTLGGEMAMYDCEINPAVAMGDVLVSDCCAFELSTADQLVSLGVCDVFGYYRKWRCSYTAVDPTGNTSEFYFYVVQYDTTAPTIYNVPEDLVLECDATVEPADSTIYAEDACALNSNLQFDEQIIVDPSDTTKYAIVRTWTAEDHCENLAEEAQIIAVCGFDTDLIASAIGSSVWSDQNRNGIQDEEELGINGIRVNLYTYDTVAEKTIELVATTLTRKINNKDGQYQFKYLLPNFYVLEVESPSYLSLTRIDAGEDDAVDSDFDPASALTPGIDLMSSNQLMNYDAGLVRKRQVQKSAVQPNLGAIGFEGPLGNVDVTTYPNPFRDIVNIEFTSARSGDVDLQIYDSVGRLISTENLTAVKGLNQHQVALENIPIGTYFVRLEMSDWTAHKMIIKAQ